MYSLSEYEGGRLTVFMEESACDALRHHVSSETRYEVGGALLGKYCVSEGGAEFLKITEVFPQPSEYFQEAAFFRFKHEYFLKLDAHVDALKTTDPSVQQLGLYHSHPGFGVFLSPTDVRTFEGIFREQWHLAMVVDPLRNEGGVFFREADGVSSRRGFFIYRMFEEIRDPCPEPSANELPRVVDVLETADDLRALHREGSMDRLLADENKKISLQGTIHPRRVLRQYMVREKLVGELCAFPFAEGEYFPVFGKASGGFKELCSVIASPDLEEVIRGLIVEPHTAANWQEHLAGVEEVLLVSPHDDGLRVLGIGHSNVPQSVLGFWTSQNRGNAEMKLRPVKSRVQEANIQSHEGGTWTGPTDEAARRLKTKKIRVRRDQVHESPKAPTEKFADQPFVKLTGNKIARVYQTEDEKKDIGKSKNWAIFISRKLYDSVQESKATRIGAVRYSTGKIGDSDCDWLDVLMAGKWLPYAEGIKRTFFEVLPRRAGREGKRGYNTGWICVSGHSAHVLQRELSWITLDYPFGLHFDTSSNYTITPFVRDKRGFRALQDTEYDLILYGSTEAGNKGSVIDEYS